MLKIEKTWLEHIYIYIKFIQELVREEQAAIDGYCLAWKPEKPLQILTFALKLAECPVD